MAASVPVMPAAAFVAGVFSHQAYFRSGEHHLYGMRYCLIVTAAFIISIFAQSHFFEVSVSTSLPTSSLLLGCYLGGLYTSLTIYRALFHPLRKFSGPFGCRISSAWFATYLVKQDAFRQLEKLHRKHGSFLRIGSNDLSVSHPQAVHAVYGNGSKCRKAAWYDLTYPMVSLQSTRDHTLHSQRRRVWSAAFGDRNLRDYEKRMAQYRAVLLNAIGQSNNCPMDMAKWFNLFTFDVMGDLAFGSSFRMLETSKEHEAIRLLNFGLKPLGFMFPMWFFRFMTGVPGMARNWWKFIDYCTSQLESRMQMKIDTPDIMSCLLKPLRNQSPTKLEHSLLQGDSQLIVVAGSDTTSTTLTNIFNFLAQQPHHIGILRSEIDPLPRTELGDYIHTDLTDLKHLDGIINEALRLYPPVPSALPRLTPPDGLTIDGTFIPGNVTIYCPQYVIGRNPECFVEPNQFIPERWYSRPELIRDASGFAPFSTGPYGCIGRPLALLNIRATVSRIIADYDVSMAVGSSVEDYDSGLTEHFTLAPASLQLCFAKRKSSV